MISPSWGLPPRRRQRWGEEQIVLAHQAEHPLAGNPDVATDPKPSPDLAVGPRPPRAMPPGRLRSPPAAPGPRSRASVPDALPAAARRAGRRSWRRTRSGPCPRRRRPAAGRRPDPCRARWAALIAATSAAPKGRRSPSWPPSSSTCMVNSPIRFMALSSSACTGSPLRCLSEASIPPVAFSRHCSSRKISTPNWRDRSCTGSSRKSRRTTSRLAATVHRWPSPSGPAGKAWPGEKRGRAKLARIYHRPINSNFLLKIIGHVPVLLGHFD